MLIDEREDERAILEAEDRAIAEAAAPKPPEEIPQAGHYARRIAELTNGTTELQRHTEG